MLNELEQEIIKNHKRLQFGAYLQWTWFEYPELQEQISRREYPEQTKLIDTNKIMAQHKAMFDYCYFHSLPQAEVNPLQVEQDAWELLSPEIKQHLDEFENYIKGYSPQNVDKEQLLAYVNNSWVLMQKWNIISNSYKAKYEKRWDIIEEKEQAARKLIQELQAVSS